MMGVQRVLLCVLMGIAITVQPVGAWSCGVKMIITRMAQSLLRAEGTWDAHFAELADGMLGTPLEPDGQRYGSVPELGCFLDDARSFSHRFPAKFRDHASVPPPLTVESLLACVPAIDESTGLPDDGFCKKSGRSVSDVVTRYERALHHAMRTLAHRRDEASLPELQSNLTTLIGLVADAHQPLRVCDNIMPPTSADGGLGDIPDVAREGGARMLVRVDGIATTLRHYFDDAGDVFLGTESIAADRPVPHTPRGSYVDAPSWSADRIAHAEEALLARVKVAQEYGAEDGDGIGSRDRIATDARTWYDESLHVCQTDLLKAELHPNQELGPETRAFFAHVLHRRIILAAHRLAHVLQIVADHSNKDATAEMRIATPPATAEEVEFGDAREL